MIVLMWGFMGMCTAVSVYSIIELKQGNWTQRRTSLVDVWCCRGVNARRGGWKMGYGHFHSICELIRRYWVILSNRPTMVLTFTQLIHTGWLHFAYSGTCCFSISKWSSEIAQKKGESCSNLSICCNVGLQFCSDLFLHWLRTTIWIRLVDSLLMKSQSASWKRWLSLPII